MAGFDAEWAEWTVNELAARDVEFTTGLTNADIEEIAAAFGTEVPPELALFLSAGVPVSPRWARWAEGPIAVADEARSWIVGAFTSDVRHGQYWHSLFGDRPTDGAAAIARALNVVQAAPPLIPIYSHRFLSSAPPDGRHAVLSVWQAVDSIVYGNDLADYFAREFALPRPSWASDHRPDVPVWEDLFDL